MPADLDRIERACRHLQQEMLDWARGERSVGGRAPSGTLAHLCEIYELDPESPFQEKRDATKTSYLRYLALLKRTAGSARLSRISGKTIRGWHTGWLAHGVRNAQGGIQLLRIVLRYGLECSTRQDDHCRRLVEVLHAMRFKSPRARTKRVEHEHVEAFRPAALDANRFSIALAVSLQFDLGLRQKDVIGEWVWAPPSDRVGGRIWQWGLTWDQIDENWILRKPTSKSNGGAIAEHDLKAYPETLALLRTIPVGERVGPIVIDERSRQPYRRRQFKVLFRRIANTTAWPKDVWNMDCRAGAVSEALEAGAEPADVMKAATHTQMSTTMGYNRGGVVQSSRVAELRVARRNARKPKPAPASDDEPAFDSEDANSGLSCASEREETHGSKQ
ncbi:integrase [Bosea sp. F3-2]|uniref:integrase n=1 Tax=Bosea sp. F3-2 TaxID=2599640 RepID=UPI001655DFBE|nr:integrase [Bosea sp. F3-2]